MGDEPIGGPVERDRVPCPACRERIAAGASVCRFCKTRIGTRGMFADPKSNLVSCCTCPLLVAVVAFLFWALVNYVKISTR